MEFVHLHNHTHYSVLDGAITVDKLLDKTAELGMQAVAMTDHGNMCGAIEFYKKAKARGIKPIIGQEFYIAPDSRFNRKYEKGMPHNYHLLLLAENLEGYKSLLALSSVGYVDGFYYKPRIDFETLEKYHKGLICASACLGGEIPSLIMRKKYDEARKVAQKYKDLFGKDRYYLELQDHGIPEQKPVNEEVAKISNELNIPLIATNDAHYLDKEDAYAHSVLLCIQTGKTMDDETRMQFPTEEFYIKSTEEMQSLFSKYPEAISNTKKIADMCNIELILDEPVLPSFKVPDGHDLDSYLRELVYKGAYQNYGETLSQEVKDRIEYEISVITSMQFSGYFLIVWDFINHAKEQGIPVGPGRGSAAGSIVSYCMGITLLNPLKYNLLFERFLNPDRNEMPDMDIDFCGQRREEVIQYVRDKYGENHVSQIMAFNTMQPKAAVKDVARALNIPFAEANQISKHIEEKTLKKSLDQSKELTEFYKGSELGKKLIDTAMKLEGMVRSFGKHAAGVVISKDILTEYVPLYKDTKDGSISSQYEKGNSESAGLVKMDFLGLKNLSIIDHCLKLIKQNQNIDLDINAIPLDDAQVYKLLQEADTNGVFQLESSGMQAMLKRLGPTCFDDIIAAVALYRPGPLDSGMTDQFIKRKRDSKLVDYPHPTLEPVLNDTLGVIVYQEQVMKISQVMGGFSLAEADKLRKAMGKKKMEIVKDMEEQFLGGAKKRKIDTKLAEEVYDAMSKFAEYGFNKSHAAAYGLVTYQTAYLKSHYRTEYMAALLSASTGEQKDITRYINDSKTKNIEVLAPDINKSSLDFTIENNTKIRFGFRAIKGVGDKAIESILNARNEINEFANLKDFLENIDLSTVNKGVIESAIKAGAFDKIHSNRAQLFNSVDIMLETAKRLQVDKKSGQGNLFAFGSEPGEQTESEIHLIPTPDWIESARLNFEKEIVGLYLTGHPLAKYEQEIKAYSTCGSISDLEEKVSAGATSASLVGLFEAPRRIITKKGKAMAIAALEDMESSVQVIIFPKTFTKYEHLIFTGEPVMVTGKIEVEEETTIKIFAEEIKTLNDARKNSISGVHINIDSLKIEDSIFRDLKSIIQEHKGACPIFFHVDIKKENEKIVRAHRTFNIQPTDDLIKKLTSLIGKDCVRYSFKRSA